MTWKITTTAPLALSALLLAGMLGGCGEKKEAADDHSGHEHHEGEDGDDHGDEEKHEDEAK